MASRITSRRFVGRRPELAELASAVAHSGRGQCTLVLVDGEAGVGKTRLISEFSDRLTRGADPPLILRGDALPPAPGELPFAALAGALRPIIRGPHPAVDALSDADRAQLATIFPTLGADRADPRGGLDRLALFDALLALLATTSAQVPVVLIIEDCHWVDGSTLAFIDFLVRSARGERLTVILTCRTDTPPAHHRLAPLLSELHRHSAARHVELAPFTREELTEALAGILDEAPDPAVLSRLLDRSDGNPLYAEELLAAARDGRGAMPASMTDAFLARLERLATPARRVCEAVAVSASADERTIRAITALDGAEVATALQETIAAHLIVPDGGDRFRFRHSLMRESVYDALLPGRRVELHLALAARREAELTTAIGSEAELGLASQTATHWLAGGDRRSALRALVRAAGLAGRVRAPERAAELLTLALELWPHVPDAREIACVDHAGLLAEAALAHVSLGDARRADALFTAALAEMGEDSAPRRRAELLFEHAKVQQLLYHLDEATTSVELALQLMRTGEDDGLRLRIRTWRAIQLILGGHYRAARPQIEELLTSAGADGGIRIDLLGARGFVALQLGEAEAGLAAMHEALALARQAGEEVRRVELAFNLGACLSSLGRHDDAREVLLEAIAAIPVHRGPGRDRLTLKLALVAFESGDWSMARACVDDVRDDVGEVVSRVRAMRVAELAGAAGDLEGALAALEAKADEADRSPETMFFARHAALLAEILARRGELSSAVAVTTAAARRLEDYADDALRAADLHAVAVRVHADRAERARDVGDLILGDESIRQADAHLAHLASIESRCTPFDHAQIVEARAHAARARGIVRGRDWAAAAVGWEEMRMPYRAAIARLREAELRLMDGEREPAALVVRRALAAARALGSRWLVDELCALADRGRLSLPEASSVDPGSGVTDGFELTSRERQVLARLAHGDTNRQIGDALFISDKTVSTHVSRIFTKLGVSGRTKAAALAHRHGLAVSPTD